MASVTLETLARAGHAMRQAQEAYFAGRQTERAKELLIQAKRREESFDKLLEAALSQLGITPITSGLFTTAP
jgi:hypothetical protein